MPDPLAQFRVYPGRGVHFTERSLYWPVHVFENRWESHKAYRTFDVYDDPQNQDGFFHIILPKGSYKPRKEPARALGHALFALPHLTPGLTCHEVIHMARAYLQHRKIDRWTHAGEEDLCYAAQNCTDQIVEALKRRRLA